MPEVPYDIGAGFDDGIAEEHVRDALRAWTPFYLQRVMDARGLMFTARDAPRPNAYRLASDEDRWPEQGAPAMVIACPGQLGDSEVHGPAGSVAQWLQINVVVTAGGATEAGTRAKALRLAAAVRLVVAQQVPGGPIDRVRLMAGRNDLLANQRQRLACLVRAAVRVPRVVDTRGAFPTVAPQDPADTPTWPRPASTEIHVSREQRTS